MGELCKHGRISCPNVIIIDPHDKLVIEDPVRYSHTFEYRLPSPN